MSKIIYKDIHEFESKDLKELFYKTIKSIH